MLRSSNLLLILGISCSVSLADPHAQDRTRDPLETLADPLRAWAESLDLKPSLATSVCKGKTTAGEEIMVVISEVKIADFVFDAKGRKRGVVATTLGVEERLNEFNFSRRIRAVRANYDEENPTKRLYTDVKANSAPEDLHDETETLEIDLPGKKVENAYEFSGKLTLVRLPKNGGMFSKMVKTEVSVTCKTQQAKL